jgi:hypothetical protein
MSGVGKLIKKVGDAVFYGGDPAKQEAAKQAQQEQIAVQEKTIAKQEAAVNREQTELAQKAQAALKARRGGGLRSLLSGSELGLTEIGSKISKLGGGS